MGNETKVGIQTLDRSSDAIDLRLKQDPEMDPLGIETDELTLRSVDERIKQATNTILRRVEDLCAV